MVTKEIPKDLYERLFPYFINMAHKYDTKIHGLGYTNTKKLDKFPFDSVDSSTWTNGQRYGEYHKFKNGRIEVVTAGKDRRMRKDVNISYRNFLEWNKMQRYAELYL